MTYVRVGPPWDLAAKLIRPAREVVVAGYSLIELKAGADDVRRSALAREAVGPDIRIAVDGTQRRESADPVLVDHGAYRAPQAPGFPAQTRPEALAHMALPDGPAWH